MKPRHASVDVQRHYHERGWVRCDGVLPDDLIEPLRRIAEPLAARPPWPEMLSGVHNPFGFHACTRDAWSFLSVGESAELVELVASLVGPDLILWDSELVLRGPLTADEAPLWPVEPLVGAVVSLALESGRTFVVDVTRLDAARAVLSEVKAAQYVLRYMPATSHFNRDVRSAANRRAAEVRALVNYATRPIWLVCGEDRGGNDFATGFSVPAGRWGGGTDASRVNILGGEQQETQDVA